VALAGAFIGLGLVWISGYALVASAAAGWLRRPPIRRAITAVTGAVLVAFGARLATEPR
jgi:threonine/homoserine/homoserine lactone efflux protein